MAAATVGGWFGKAMVDKLVNAVFSYLEHQMNWEANTEAALKKLHAVLLPIQIAVREAEDVELDMDRKPELVAFVWQLRDAIEEAEDVIDEMEYSSLERQVLERDAAAADAPLQSTSRRRLKVHCCFSTSLFKHKFTKFGKRALKMDPTLDKLNAVADNIELINKNIYILNDCINQSPPLLGGNSSAVQIYNTRETGNELVVEVIGREQDKERAIKWLKRSNVDDSKISALNIWGIGGVGKTTLAQTLYNDNQHLKDYFKVKMWVCVSNNNISMTEIMKKSIESFTKCSPNTTIFSGLQDEVKNIVSSKKCLLVLDDVWDGQNNQSSQEWEKFVGLLSKYADKGSKILVTSRIKSVADSILQFIPIQKEEFRLGCLQKQESLTLFNKYAFAGANRVKYMSLQSVGEGIAKKCGGLPLALKIIGSTLNRKLDISYWISILKNDFLHSKDIMAILKYSYRSLPSNLQSCFRMCSLFPQDYEYEEDELVALWMTAGCIIKDGNKLPEDIGRDYLNILVTTSFFVSQREGRYAMHDLLHNLARDVSRGECFRVEDNNISDPLPQTLRHLFVGELNPNLIEKISSLKKLRTLIINNKKESRAVSHSSADSFHELDDLLKNLNSLRALFLNVTSMPNLNAIGNLIHLRLFHMDGHYVFDKPFKPLYKLYHLQNLKCYSNHSQEEIKNSLESGSELDGLDNLIKLRHLRLHHLVYNKINQVRHLTELQELWMEMNEENALKFSDLKDLNMLRKVTIIYNHKVGVSVEEAGLANLKEKKHLLSLSLHFNCLHPKLHEQVSNCLQPLLESNIKKLYIVNYRGMQSISWMNIDYLLNVTIIRLHHCVNLKHFPPLGELPCLQVLSLQHIPCVTQLGIHFFGSNDIKGFPSLEQLKIVDMGSFEEWTGADIAGWFPCLKELYIQRCKCLKELPRLPLSLKSLKLWSVGLVAIPAWQDMHENGMSMYDSEVPGLEELYISGCDELVTCDQVCISNCVSLKELTISNCPKLSSICGFNGLNHSTPSPSLDSLTIEGCNNLIVAAENQQKATYFLFHVKKVEIDSLSLLQIEPLRSITSAEELIIDRDWQSTSFPHQWLLQNHTSLRKLFLKGLHSLPFVPDDLQKLCSLTTLLIDDVPLLKSLPEMPSSLANLHIDNLPLLKSLPDMRSSLTQLRIDNLPLLKSLPEMPSSLTELYIEDVPLLTLLPEMPSSLIELEMRYIPLLKALPDKMPSKLTVLTIIACPLLAKQCEQEEGPDWPKIAQVPHLSIF